MKTTTHAHPNPSVNRITHYIAFGLLIVMLLTVPLQFVLAVALNGGLLALMAFFTLLLTAPVVMYLSATPAITISDEGIEIQPVIWKRQFIPWDQVITVKRYPLLPQAEAETNRKYMVGRHNYQAAEGKMIIVTGLPFQYRSTGFFAGERLRPVIAITNRTHTEYDRLVKRVLSHKDEAPEPERQHI